MSFFRVTFKTADAKWPPIQQHLAGFKALDLARTVLPTATVDQLSQHSLAYDTSYTVIIDEATAKKSGWFEVNYEHTVYVTWCALNKYIVWTPQLQTPSEYKFGLSGLSHNTVHFSWTISDQLIKDWASDGFPSTWK